MNAPVDPITIEPQRLSLRTQLLSGGLTRTALVEGENTTMHLMCYASGLGENHGIHAHPDEEHGFIILSGEALFNTPRGRLPVLRKHEGLWLPKGCFYEFYNPAAEPLVMLRIGAADSRALLEGRRLTPEGEPIPGRDATNPVFIPGAFFE